MFKIDGTGYWKGQSLDKLLIGRTSCIICRMKETVMSEERHRKMERFTASVNGRSVAVPSIRFPSKQRNAAMASLNSSLRTYSFDIRVSFSPLSLFRIGPIVQPLSSIAVSA